jgi:hypothetical protein
VTRNFRLGPGARSRQASQLYLGSVAGFGLPAGFGLGQGFSLDPGRVFTAGVPFGSLRGDAVRPALSGPAAGQGVLPGCLARDPG